MYADGTMGLGIYKIADIPIANWPYYYELFKRFLPLIKKNIYRPMTPVILNLKNIHQKRNRRMTIKAFTISTIKFSHLDPDTMNSLLEQKRNRILMMEQL